MKLPMPVVCQCGFNTMDAQKAVEHAEWHQRQQNKRKHYKVLEAIITERFRKNTPSHCGHCEHEIAYEDYGDVVGEILDGCIAYIEGEG